MKSRIPIAFVLTAALAACSRDIRPPSTPSPAPTAQGRSADDTLAQAPRPVIEVDTVYRGSTPVSGLPTEDLWGATREYRIYLRADQGAILETAVRWLQLSSGVYSEGRPLDSEGLNSCGYNARCRQSVRVPKDGWYTVRLGFDGPDAQGFSFAVRTDALSRDSAREGGVLPEPSLPPPIHPGVTYHEALQADELLVGSGLRKYYRLHLKANERVRLVASPHSDDLELDIRVASANERIDRFDEERFLSGNGPDKDESRVAQSVGESWYTVSVQSAYRQAGAFTLRVVPLPGD